MSTPPILMGSLPEASPPKTYSPVNVRESPLTAQAGQLRGIPRKIRDSAADLFNAVQQWNKLHIEGMDIIQQIKNKKLDQIENGDVTDLYPDGLQDLCDALERTCLKLVGVVSKMKTVLKNIEAVKQLEDMKSCMKPIFVTWTAEKYVEIANSLSKGYCKEIQMKNHIKENVGHVSSKEDIMLYCALWAHQPYVEHHFTFLIEAMLKECGHR